MLIAVLALLWAAPLWAQPPAGVIEYYHVDGLGSVRAVTNASGATVRTHHYHPFGEGVGVDSTTDPLRFTGKSRDAETGLDYFGARYHVARSARFTTVDPVVNSEMALIDPQRWNRYAYVRNNPFRFLDPDGQDTVPTRWQMTHGADGLAKVLAAAGKSIWNVVVSLNSPGHLNAEGEARRQSQFMQPSSTEELVMMTMTDAAMVSIPLVGRSASGASNPISGLPRVGSALKRDKYHAFPDIVDNYAAIATRTTLDSGAVLHQLRGTLNGVAGRFEWIVQDGRVTHRLFVPGAELNGVPIKR